jgi:hypothetical protein
MHQPADGLLDGWSTVCPFGEVSILTSWYSTICDHWRGRAWCPWESQKNQAGWCTCQIDSKLKLNWTICTTYWPVSMRELVEFDVARSRCFLEDLLRGDPSCRSGFTLLDFVSACIVPFWCAAQACWRFGSTLCRKSDQCLAWRAFILRQFPGVSCLTSIFLYYRSAACNIHTIDFYDLHCQGIAQLGWRRAKTWYMLNGNSVKFSVNHHSHERSLKRMTPEQRIGEDHSIYHPYSLQ